MKRQSKSPWLVFAILLLICGPEAARAQFQAPPPPHEYYPLAADQIDQLASRVALYPDAILSELFVACTYPDQVLDANRWLAAGNNPAGADQQNWDLSVKGLAHYPDLVARLAADPGWMNEMGSVFLNQQQDVMDSVQRLRGRALANGTLFSTPQQEVVQDSGIIEIVPADPQTLYVPAYDPNVVFASQPWPPGTTVGPYLTFSAGYPVGVWLHHDFDWDDRRVYVGDWGRDRPWWNWRGHARYEDDRPARYVPRDRPDWRPQAWGHDDHDPGPRFSQPDVRPDRLPYRGYQAPESPEVERGYQASRDAQRGRESRQAPARQEPSRGEQPRSEQPRGEQPQSARGEPREAPREQRPAPAPVERREAAPIPPRAEPAPSRRDEPQRPSAPARSAPGGREGGGAFGGYGGDAGRSSERGAASRGGGALGGPAAGGAHGGGGRR